MKLIATMPVRNEAWVIGFSLRVALLWCDEIVVLNHASTDRSVDIIADLMRENPGRIHLISVPELQWDEMQHRQMMLTESRRRGATHIAIVDADEVLTANLLERDGGTWGSEMRHGIAPGFICQLPGYNLRGGLNRYHANGIWGNRWFSTTFKDAPDLGWSGDKHHSREPGPRKLTPYQPQWMPQGRGGILHLWGASEQRLVAKHALYKVRDVLRWPDRRAQIEREYNWAIKGDPNVASYGTPDTWTYTETPEAWLAPYKNLLQYLDIHATPWQEAETRRLVMLHGKETFTGLDLFGVV